MLAATLQTQEDTQKSKEAVSPVSPSESGQMHSKRKLPVGASVSSVNIDYEYFEIGTGQVRLCRSKQFKGFDQSSLFTTVFFNVDDLLLVPLKLTVLRDDVSDFCLVGFCGLQCTGL